MDQHTALYIGALLHDIGKFAWRAENLRPGQDHEKLGEYFIREYLGKVACCRESIDEIIAASQRGIPAILRADVTTAAGERETQQSTQSRRLLLSAFQRITIGRAEKPSGTYYIEPIPITTDVRFPMYLASEPSDWTPDEGSMIGLHKPQWYSFCKEVSTLQGITDTRAFCETLYTLLEKYTANVSSASYRTLPDISLFDHSRVTAALSLCYAEGDSSNECLLVQGDISGIQRFIYASLGAAQSKAKILRGRSFFITLLSETVVAYLIRRLQIFRANVLFNSGGHFLILVPNNDANSKALEDAERRINTMLFTWFGHGLQLVIASHEVSGDSLFHEYEQVQKQITHKMQASKRQKSLSVLDQLMLESGHGDSISSVLERLGEDLPKSDVLIEVHADTKPTNVGIAFDELGIYWVLTPSEEVERELSRLHSQAVAFAVVHNLRSTDISPYAHLLSRFSFPVALRFLFVGHHAPKSRRAPDSLADFDELAELGSENYPLLGFARMDVDSLGSVMLLGLREQTTDEKKFTVSRFARLSRELTHFFSAHINKLAKEHNIYLVYSGGDDLFAVGSWVNALEFVRAVRKEFSRFTCSNGNITISCGIAFTKPAYPIHRAAELAGEQQDRAKNMRKEKNAISLLDCPVSWEQLDQQIDLAKRILEVVDETERGAEQKLPLSFIHTLLAATQNVFERKGGAIRIKGVAYLLRTIARLRYAFARRGIDARFLEEQKDKVQSQLVRVLLDTPDDDRRNTWRNFRIAASYVIWKKRKTL
ncbi:MAG: type III-A CRISPR-associated protein Cas10/Csm1 [Bacteroidota bacterium]